MSHFSTILQNLQPRETPKEFFEELLNCLCLYWEWTVGHIYYSIYEEKTILTPSEIWYLPEQKNFSPFQKETRQTPFFQGKGILGKIIHTHQPIWIEDVRRDPTFVRKTSAQQCGLLSCLAFPILISGKVVAVIELFSSESKTFDQDWFSQLNEFAEKIGERISRIYLYSNHSEQSVECELSLSIRASDIIENNKLLREEISKREEIEAQLFESKERFRIMAETAPVMIWMAGTNGSRTYFNKNWLQFTGRSIKQDQGHGWTENLHSADYTRIIQKYENRFKAREPFTFVYRLRRQDGEYRWIMDNGVPRWNSNKTFAGYIGSCIDITNQKYSQEELQDLYLDMEDQAYAKNIQLTQTDAALQSEIRDRKQIEERFRLLIENVDEYAIYMLDINGHIISWNKGAEKIKGYSQEEILGKHFSCFYTREDQENHVPEQHLREARQVGKKEYMGWRCRKDGSCFYADVVLTSIFDEKGEFMGFAKITKDITEKMKTELQLNEYSRRMQQLSHTLMDLQENERRKIARDLHDELSQKLTAIQLGLEKCQFTTDIKQIHSDLEQCIHISSEVLKFIRNLVSSLRPGILDDLGLLAAVRSYVNQLQMYNNLQIHLHIQGNESPLPKEVESNCFRIVQELLNNVIRHADANHAWVYITKTKTHLYITVKDDGIGMDMNYLDQVINQSQGFGMLGIYERVGILNGEIQINTKPDHGMETVIQVPIKEKIKNDTADNRSGE